MHDGLVALHNPRAAGSADRERAVPDRRAKNAAALLVVDHPATRRAVGPLNLLQKSDRSAIR